ncbi:MAG: glycosyltransferase family 2 protein [Patescibacteria group bacterium]
MKKISIIIVNYCTKSLIERNVSNLLNGYENCEIIFIDNNSPDGSADLVQEKFGNNLKVTLIRTQNTGLAAGYNLGLEKATGDYILYLGTDTFPTKEILPKLVEYMDNNSQVGVATAKLYTRDGVVDIDAHRGFPTPMVAITHLMSLDKLFPKSRFFNGYSMGYMGFNTIHEIDACVSHFMFVRPEVHKKIGNWDSSYWLFGEDVDFCYRVKQAGFKIMYMGTLPVLHYKGAAVGRDTSKDIDSVMNKDFDSITFKNERIEISQKKDGAKKEEQPPNVKVSSTKLWMKIRVAKESTRAMRTFYNKHLIKKYPIFLSWFVFFGIWVNEQIKVTKIWLKNYL